MGMNNVMKKRLKSICFYIVLAVMVAILLFPFLIMLSTSLKVTSEAIQYGASILPRKITLEHYQAIFNPNIFPFIQYFKNSLLVSVLSASISVVIGILGGYAISKLKFAGRLVINESFYLVYMFSGILLIVPLFKMISSLGMYNTRTALIISMVIQTLPTSIYMLKSYFDTIPEELEEAGLVDGLNRIGCIIRIIIPLAISGIISVFVYAFMIAWNDYLFASIFLSSSGLFTLPIGLNGLFSTPDYIWGRMMAASLVTSLPVVIMYSISERLIKGGAAEGGVKG